MLGRTIADPFNVEEGGTVEGLDLLPAETRLCPEKITVRSQGRSFLGVSVTGYEIHVGETEPCESVAPFIERQDGTADGVVSGCVAGTYFHGIFDNPEFTREFLSRVAASRRIDWRPSEIRHSKDSEYDRLATKVREHLDIKRIYDLIQ
jgi:adenosylcobyric acid synthase